MERFNPLRPHFSPYGFSCVRWKPSIMPKADRHNEIELNLLPSGHIAYLRGGKKIWVETGRLCAFWAAIPHQVIAHQDVANYFVATVPLAWFLS